MWYNARKLGIGYKELMSGKSDILNQCVFFTHLK